MGWLDKLLGRTRPAPPPAATESAPCPHATLVPKWDSTADMGHEDKVSGYRCDSCQQTFTAEEGRELRRTEAERLKKNLAI